MSAQELTQMEKMMILAKEFDRRQDEVNKLRALNAELLEALEEAENYLVSYNGSLPHTDARLIKIRAAIAKAR